MDDDKVGSASDHQMVVMTPLNNFQNKKGRAKETVDFRPFTENGFRAMGSELDSFDWSVIVNIETASGKMEFFQKSLYQMFDSCFPRKRRTFFSETQPFFTEKLEKLKRRKSREYTENRKSKKYMDLQGIYRKELKIAKKAYYRKRIQALRTSNPNC